MQFLLSARNSLFMFNITRNITSRTKTKNQNKYFWMVNSNFKPNDNDNDIEYDDYDIISKLRSEKIENKSKNTNKSRNTKPMNTKNINSIGNRKYTDKYLRLFFQ